MDFSEKLSRLLALTRTQSTQLANAVFLDPSQISRMKTGLRGKPKNQKTIRLMADYFSAHCSTDYQLLELSKLTTDTRILKNASPHTINDTIYHWLRSDTVSEESADNFTGALLEQLDEFPLIDSNILKANKASSLSNSNPLISYTDNEGKRNALLAMLEDVLSCDEVKEIYLFSDENMEWLYEDPGFTQQLDNYILNLAKSGCHFIRITPPDQSLGYTIGNIQRWLSAYVLGCIQEFYYPFVRDGLHRRSIFVAPGKSAVFSRSLANQKHNRLTFYCTDSTMVSICKQEVQDILSLCRPLMQVHTLENYDDIFMSRVRITGIHARGIYRTASLSIVTLPNEVLERIQRESKSPLAAMMLRSHTTCYKLLTGSLHEYPVDDIMTLPNIEDIFTGQALIPSTVLLPDGPICYKPDEYALHLQRTIEMMEKYDNYHVYLTEDSHLHGVNLICKCDSNVLLVKGNEPFSVFEISEQRYAYSFCEYLRQIISYERVRTTRDDIIGKLKATLLAVRDRLTP